MLTLSRLQHELQISKTELNALLIQKFKLTQPSIHAWWKQIPPQRQIQIIQFFNLDPKILIDKKVAK